ncbi:alpha/beta hydrolase family protein [Acinetobacter pseudolwoffii]|uniref:alpha/beta hydrolase family protein n=1 Tax=Acinetobacter sp. YH12255 TaxID=2601179 RepID=UPI00211EBE69|nr:lipase family protein [Acinetobacter sp. YH12255]
MLGVLCSSVLFLSACNDDDDDNFIGFNPVRTYAVDEQVKTVVERHDIFTYRMEGVQGREIRATTLVFTPKGTPPVGGWPIVVWAHGTTGAADKCAPSRLALDGPEKALVMGLVERGYAVIAPDYEGLGTQGIHPYLHLESAAQSAIYAVKGFKQQQGNRFNGAWVSVGQSQGGHASLATAEFAGNDPNYKAAVAAAPASSLGYIIGTVAPQALNRLVLGEGAGVVPAGTAKAVYSELLAYAAYVAVGIKAYEPNFVYQNIFESSAKLVAERAEGTTGENGLCLGDLMTEFSADIDQWLRQNPGRTVAEYPGLIDAFDQNRSVKEFLVENQPATKKISVPVMIIQGKEDMAVPYDVTDVLQKNLAALGTDVTFLGVEGAGHTQAIVEKNAELVAFIEEHMPAK